VPTPGAPPASRLDRTALALLAGLALLLPGAGSAAAATTDAATIDGGETGLQIHHLLPENGAFLATAPDHVEIIFDRDLEPGGVDVGIAPDDTGHLVVLPGRPVVDGPVVVQPLPALAPGHYTVGVQVLDRAGSLARGTFGFTVDPAAASAAGSTGLDPDGHGDAAWLIPMAATALLLPAALLARRRGRR
jgi:methionine-rich copper-binding protein CopC